MGFRFSHVALAMVLAAGLSVSGQEAPKGSGTGAEKKAETPKLASKVAVVTIHGVIDYGLQKSLERRVALALDWGAEVIMFEMDTPGGLVDSSEEIGNMINNIKVKTDGRVKTVAYVHTKAISGGAMVSLAAQEIVMRHTTTLGDCQAILVNPLAGTFQVAPEKMQTTVRATVRGYAESNGYPVVLCEAMVDPDVEVYQVKSPDGTTRYVRTDEIGGLKSDEKSELKTKLVIAKGKLLTMNDKEAHEYGFSRATVDTADEAANLYKAPGGSVSRYETNWSEEMVRFLNSMGVSSLLLIGGFIALYMAFKMPGFGVAETVAIFCFGVLFFSKYLAGLATAPEIVLFVLGLVLLAVEFFVIPGFGVVGILGILCVFVSLVLSLQGFTIPHMPFQVDILLMNLLMVIGSIFVATALFVLLVRLMPSTPGLRRLVLTTEQTAEAGYVVGSASKRGLIGKTGTALSTLRPSGRAEIEGETMLAVSDGEFIERGSAVKVSDVHGNRIVVIKS